MPKKPSSETDKYNLNEYNFDDGVDPRELLPSKKGSKLAKGKKLFHDTWAEKIASEHTQDVYYEEDLEEKKRQENKGKVAMVDHDHNSRGKSPMIPVPQDLVATDKLAAPKSKKKLSFRKLVKIPRRGGNSKKV